MYGGEGPGTDEYDDGDIVFVFIAGMYIRRLWCGRSDVWGERWAWWHGCGASVINWGVDK